jgi:hypothetical protein
MPSDEIVETKGDWPWDNRADQELAIVPRRLDSRIDSEFSVFIRDVAIRTQIARRVLPLAPGVWVV